MKETESDSGAAADVSRMILLCEIGLNYRLGEALGMERHGKVWAVECPPGTPGALEWGGKYYRRFSSFQEAELYALRP